MRASHIKNIIYKITPFTVFLLRLYKTKKCIYKNAFSIMLQNLSLLNEIIPEIEVMNKMRNPLLDDRLIEVTLLEDRLY